MKVSTIIPLFAAAIMASPIPEAEPGKTVVISGPHFTKTFTEPSFPKPTLPSFSFPSFPIPSFPSFPTPSFPAHEEREAHHSFPSIPKPTHHSWEHEKPSFPPIPVPTHHSWEKPTHSFPTEFPKPTED